MQMHDNRSYIRVEASGAWVLVSSVNVQNQSGWPGIIQMSMEAGFSATSQDMVESLDKVC
jgi:hypothetical protein